jgi:hypothetical protein
MAVGDDQYGIRTLLEVEAVPIKFEIVLETCLELDCAPDGYEVGSERTLTHLD